MEIEAKFLVPEERDFSSLKDLSSLARYKLSEAKIQTVEDIFLDTQDRAIMAAGYYLRVRKALEEEGRWVTIKSLGGFEAGTHTREEYVSFLPEKASVLECPDLHIRNMVFEFTAGLDLVPLLSLKQKRIIRQVESGQKIIAEIYLDQVNLKIKGKTKNYNEFEVELKNEGTSEDLEIIRNFLLTNYNLTESPFSKFERAFLFMEELPEKTFLSLSERAYCAQLAAQNNRYAKKAKILLALDRDQNFEEVSYSLEISQNEIDSVKLKFEKERLFLFPFRNNKEKNLEFHLQPRASALKRQKKTTDFKEWSLEALLEYYGADNCQAEKARNNALTLFDELSMYHFLGQEEREILGIAAFLKDIAALAFPEEETQISTEILLSHPIKGLKTWEILMLALIIELQNPCIREKNCISILNTSSIKLPAGLQNKALTLAAILRPVNAFNSSYKIQQGKAKQLQNAIEIEVIGEENQKFVKKGEKKGELWRYLFERKLTFVQATDREIIDMEEKKEESAAKEAGEETTEKFKEEAEKEKKAEKKKRKLKKVTVKPTDSMAGLASRIFSYQFSSMLAHEKGTIKGEDIEELHDMRVAVRRMRAASKIFEQYVDFNQLEPHLKELRKTLGVLGEVRDLDVFREKAENYLKTLSAEHEHDLDPLFTIISEKREKARIEMRDYLESDKHNRFKQEFATLLSSPEALTLPTTNKKHDALPHRVIDVLPAILYARMADITAYSEWVEGPYLPIARLHRLRIAAKGIRYTLEFFESVLGEDAKTLIQDFKTLQDHLGNLHDAIIAIEMLGSYLKTGEWRLEEDKGDKGDKEEKKSSGKEDFPEDLDGLKAYLTYREEELQTLLNTFPDVWANIANENLRKRIENSIKNLYKTAT